MDSSEIEIRAIRKEDYAKAEAFAAEGMHFNWYAKVPFVGLLGVLFFRMQLNEATQVIAAYKGEKFLGVLLARIDGEPKVSSRWWITAILAIGMGVLGIASWVSGLFGDDLGFSPIDPDEDMLKEFKRNHDPDGELLFLAADPHCGVKGVGTTLLKELERREPGKLIYLFTDTGCTYQFYEKRGFVLPCECTSANSLDGDGNPIGHFLYCKRLPSKGESGAGGQGEPRSTRNHHRHDVHPRLRKRVL